MRSIIIPLALVFSILVCHIQAQDFTKLQWSDCGSPSAVISNIDLTPMPVYNPGPASITLKIELKKAVKTVGVNLNIIRSVSGIKLPVRCYLVDGAYVGSCNYTDLCTFLKSIWDDFKPETCSPVLLDYGIDCTCPFNISPLTLDLNDLPLDLPDASQSAASFMASGNFDITVAVFEGIPLASPSYGCAKVQLTVKQKK
ncbi:unnamed protein product [Rotaria magnacalcarata]|uniref:Ganglioside GM2 activator n=1 Tax=Rotaria magnacalcarata TaxID=392030 RepID=A0A816U5P7_9BILA|nr:unnamed protein product [Rotaria magnacalcarata]CAF3939201.1 unnamed protein product [Rotaria magnacalcarata]